MNAPTDEELLRGFLAGQASSFELLVRRHSHELYQFVVRFTGDSALAEDIVQEAFLQVHSAAAQFDQKRRFKPWLFTIAANKARDHLRKRGRRREVGFDAQLASEDAGGRSFVQLLSGESPPPDESIELDERKRLVRRVVDDMPDGLREVLTLAYFHKFPYKQIAEILEIPLGTVKSRLHAAVGWFGEKYREALSERMR